MNVTIETTAVGQNFATIGIIRNARTGRVIAVEPDLYLRPSPALASAAEALAEILGAAR